MLDIRLFRTVEANGFRSDPVHGSRDGPCLVRESQGSRFASVELVDEVISLDEAWRRKNSEAVTLRRELNDLSKFLGELKLDRDKQDYHVRELADAEVRMQTLMADLEGAVQAARSMLGAASDGRMDVLQMNLAESKAVFEEMETLATKMAEMQELKSQSDKCFVDTSNTLVGIKNRLSAKVDEVRDLRAMLNAKLMAIGNILHDTVPISNDETNNVTIETWGERRLEENLDNHVYLCRKLGIADFEKGATVAGNRGFFLVGDGVLLNQALINYGLAFLRKRGFKAMQTPFFLRNETMEKCAQLSQYDEELYKLSSNGDEKYLISTSEQPLCAYHQGDRILAEQLPIRYAGFSTCFRKEAGSHGSDTPGIFRVHQFEKIEQFCITSPHDNCSWEMFFEMLTNSQDFYKELGLPHRVVSVVSGALNDAAAKKYDLEAWFPASKTYRELVSCTNCTDYQARRLGIRYGQTKAHWSNDFVHLLNCTLTATERTICCILENYQTEDGVIVPKVLQPYMGGLEFLPFQKTQEREMLLELDEEMGFKLHGANDKSARPKPKVYKSKASTGKGYTA